MQQLLEASVASNTFSEYIKNKGVGILIISSLQ
jgi:hypothetical protein